MMLTTPVEQLTRVGATTSARLHRMGIFTAKDLLFHFPHRYEDWSQKVPIKDIKPYQSISLQGKIESIRNFRSGKRKMKLTEAFIQDETGNIRILWFNQPFLTKTLAPGTEVSLSGKVDVNRGELYLKSPQYEVITDQQDAKYTGRIVPVYPSSLNLSQKQFIFLTQHVLHLANDLSDPLPASIREEYKFPDLSTCIKILHQPANLDEVELARQRFAFEEVFYLQLQSAVFREQNSKQQADSLQLFEEEIKGFVETLPFELTDDQKKTAYKIFQETEKPVPMNRLVQGDVGAGKTVVAAMAMYNTALNGYQSALMAPTEVLATQHYRSISKLFEKLDLPIALLTRTQHFISHSGKEEKLSKKKLISKISAGEVAMVIGTHALIQQAVSFRHLALAIIDEQHRFGVEQRKALREYSGEQSTTPHLLTMTATPIPRSLALVLYGDLAISSIRQKPKNRLPIKTYVVGEEKRNDAYEFIKKELEKGQQAFVVCPLIEESDKLGVASVQDESEKLRKIFPQYRIATLHGKLPSKEKDLIMQDFKQKKSDILVSTTVIEVGVDVPNATMMLIEGAERFGFSQLHQIRGRVGRGDVQSYCFLLPTAGETNSFGRLQRFVDCKDGFEVSELDLQTRGSGEVFGTRQSGEQELVYTDITDTLFIQKVHDAAQSFLQKNTLEEYPFLQAHIQAMINKVHLE